MPDRPVIDPSVTRVPVHSRQITCRGFRRSDGLWDIEGDLSDIRDEPVRTAMLDLSPGQPMHDLALVMVVDEALTIHDLRPRFQAAATPECHQIAGNYRALIGTPISAGFSRRVAQAVGGTRGCTHMTTLLKAMANAAIQSMWNDRAETRDGLPDWLVGSCHGYRVAGLAVQAMAPELYRPEAPED